MAKKVIIIAGNIGAGKSTLVKYINQKGNFKCIQEFIDKSWRDLFYSNRKRYTGPFEMSCLMGRKARYLNAKNENSFIVFDRGLIEAREIFVQNSFDEGFLSFADLQDYDTNLKKALDELGRNKEDSERWRESIIVYLKAPPRVCFERQNKRMMEKGDKGEMIPLEYFERIHKYYERFMLNIDETYRRWGLISMPKLLIIDASQDIEKNPQYLERTYQLIRDSLDIKDEKRVIPKSPQLPQKPSMQDAQSRGPQNPQQKPQNQKPAQVVHQMSRPVSSHPNQQRATSPPIIKITRPWHVPTQQTNQQNPVQHKKPQNQNPQMKLNNPSLKPIDQVIREIMQRRSDLKNEIIRKQQMQSQKTDSQQSNANRNKKWH